MANKNHNQHTGAQGETIATEYLIQQGYTIKEKNWRTAHLEIDIIADDGIFLMIIEVKTRINPLKTPESSINQKKRQNLFQAAQAYLHANPCILEIRFDVITVILNKHNAPAVVTHYTDAFYPNW